MSFRTVINQGILFQIHVKPTEMVLRLTDIFKIKCQNSKRMYAILIKTLNAISILLVHNGYLQNICEKYF